MYLDEYKRWLAADLEDADLKPELSRIEGNDEEIKDRFAVALKFGTAGLRGVLGAGTNRMNIYVVRQATQGLANWVKTQGGSQTVAISYDSRLKSDVFAKTAAGVLAANGIKVRIYDALMPVPALSFATRYYECNAGIMVTASHNPAKYNGYKAYGPDGCQMTDDAAAIVYDEIQKTDVLTGAKYISFAAGVEQGLTAYFNEAQRKSTMDAGQIAGLNVIGIINEPTAAALAFGISKGTDKEQTVMVYDLGGGTFDVTVMQFTADNITVLGTAGDRKLGGYDFDNKIIEAVTKAAAEDGINIDADLTARQDLQLKAEAAKKSLSAKDKTNIILNVAGRPFKYTITREDFLDLVEPLLYKTVSSMENACDEAGLEYSDLDKILLVGGSTRMPIVQDFIKEETGITPSSEVHPDEAVAIGAAYHVLDLLKNQQEKAKESGHTEDKVLAADVPETTKKYSFTDVTSHGIGVVVLDENGEQMNSVILPKNVQVPAEKKNYYQTAIPYQESLSLEVTQGEEEDLRYVTVIGTAEIEIAPREQLVPLEVTISCDENSIIHVRVVDMDRHCDLGEMKIDRVSNLSEEEVKQNAARISKLDISGE